jgi:hypothetical protein
MPATYEPIATHTLSSAQASYTFTSITSAYTDLVVVMNGSVTSGAVSVGLTFNGDNGTNYSMTYLYGSGTSATSGRSSTSANIYCMDISTSNSTLICQVQNYSNTTTFKTSLQRGNAASNAVTSTVGLWRNTAAITSLTLSNSNTFITGSTFTLYGIKAA